MNRSETMLLRSQADQFRGTHGNVSYLLAIAIGIGISVVVGLAFYASKPVAPYIYALHFERGPIPYVTTSLFGLGMAILYLKVQHIRSERSTFGRDYLQKLVAPPTADAQSLLAQTLPQDDVSRFILPARVDKALDVFRKTRSTIEVSSALSDAANLDLELVHNSYFFVNFLVWLIPILGFLGTVLGISLAVGEFKSIMGSTSETVMDAMRSHIGNITGGLALAFDATLQALAFAAILKLASSVLLKYDDDFLSSVEHFCADKVIPRLRQEAGSTLNRPSGPGGVDPSLVNGTLDQILQVLVQIQSRIGAPGGADLGPVLKEISTELRSAKEVVTSAMTLNQVLGQLSQSLKSLQQMPSFSELASQIQALTKLMAEIFGRTSAART